MPLDRYIDGNRILPQTIQPDRIVGLFVNPQTGATRPTRPGDVPTTPMPEWVFNIDLIVDRAIEGIKLAAGAIGPEHLTPGSVYASALASGAVDLGSDTCTGKLAADRIAAGTIAADVIWGGTIGCDKLVVGYGGAVIQNALIGSLAAGKITAGTISASVELTSPTIRFGKTSFASTSAGFWLGRYPYTNPTGYGIHIGNATTSLKWDSATGDLTITGGTIQTAATGERAVMSSEEYYETGYTKAQLRLHTGHVNESVHGYAQVTAFSPDMLEPNGYAAGSLLITPPSSRLSGSLAQIQLWDALEISPYIGQVRFQTAEVVVDIRSDFDNVGHCCLHLQTGSGAHASAIIKSLNSVSTIQFRDAADDYYIPIEAQSIALAATAVGASPAPQLSIGGYNMRLVVTEAANTASWQVYVAGSWRTLATTTW